LKEFNNTFNKKNIQNCRDISEIYDNIFKKGYDDELDNYKKELLEITKYKDILKNIIETFFSDKIKKFEIKYEKEIIYITKTKLKKCQPKMKNGYLNLDGEKFYHKIINKKDYLTTDELEKMNLKKQTLLDKLRSRTEFLYNSYLKEISKNTSFYDNLDNCVSFVDYIKSAVKCSIKNNYVKPELDYTNDKSYFDIKDIRHPIIECINKDIPYVSNDISLNNVNKGLVLSGVNGSGKSSLLKNVGIILVIAQAGYYVPCKSLKYTPFNNILTRIKGNDNIYTNSSSFTVEMEELSNILKKTNENSLVLIDELCKGTEVMSATSLSIAVIKDLIDNKKSKFILTTHLHKIFTHNIIQNYIKTNDISLKHLSIEINDDEIIYTRKLKDGSCKPNYGLQIAKALGVDINIINNALKINNEFQNKTNDIVTVKRSIYNKDVFMTECNVCKITENLETHHIIEQKFSNKNGFILS
jgi:DNA mismatch repair protein MutS